MVSHVDNSGNPEDSDDLKLFDHGEQKRALVSLSLVVGENRDDDIIAALNALPKRERQAALKNAIRTGWEGLTPVKLDQSEIANSLHHLHKKTEANSALLEKMWKHAEWVEAQFIGLGSYLEDKFKRIGRVAVGSVFETPEEPVDVEEKATQEQLDKRKANLAKKKWK